jgi:hypothetical protein
MNEAVAQPYLRILLILANLASNLLGAAGMAGLCFNFGQQISHVPQGFVLILVNEDGFNLSLLFKGKGNRYIGHLRLPSRYPYFFG